MTSQDEGFECTYICSYGEWSFRVRYRRRNEDLIAWMEGVVRPGMAAAHREKSPLCLARHCDLKMPAPDAAKGIGMRVEQ